MENKTILIKRAFEKSDEALRSAEILIDNDSIFSACNRIYYSIFHVELLLDRAKEFIKTVKTHIESNMEIK